MAALELEYEFTDHNDVDRKVTLEITHFERQKGDPKSWGSPEDYYGHTEVEYDVFDESGSKIEDLEDIGADIETVNEWAIDRILDMGKDPED